MKYRAEIDGLRALAVVPVILFHAGFDIFKGGFVGVDVFFVISGYLITTILIDDIESKSFTFYEFYQRRARRILPALFFVMLACIPFAWIWMNPTQMKDFSQSLVAVSLFSSNVLFWLESGYFDIAAEQKPLLHTWSLGVEEQYYLLFPIFLIFMWRIGKNRVFWTIVVLAVLSLLLSEWGWRNKEAANFFLAPTRAWELFAGSISAFIVQKYGVRKNDLLAFIGLSAIFFSIFVYDEKTPFPSLYTLVPVLGVVLLVLYADKDTLVAKLLSHKFFVQIGLISYSAYLWHQPLFAFAKIQSIEPVSNNVMFLLIVVTFCLSILTWKYIEKPFRKANFFNNKTFLILCVVGFSVFVGFGYNGHVSNGFEKRFASFDLLKAKFPKRENGYCFLSFENNSLSAGESLSTCEITSGYDGDKGIIFGDSFAAQYEPFWKLIAEDLKLNVTSVTTNSCFPSPNQKFKINASDEALEQCKINRSFFKENINDFDFVVIGAAWGDYYDDNFISEIENLIKRLDNKLLIIMAAPKHLAADNVEIYNVKRIIQKFSGPLPAIPSNFDSRMRLSNDKLETLSSRFDHVHFINRDVLFTGNSDASYEWMPNGLPYHSDKRHISIDGSHQVFKNFKKTNGYGSLVDVLIAP